MFFGSASGSQFTLLFGPHLSPEHFADLGFGQHIAEFYVMGNLVRGESLSAPVHKLKAANRAYVLPGNYEGLDALTDLFVGDAHHTGR
jgi:hypothetical protein